MIIFPGKWWANEQQSECVCTSQERIETHKKRSVHFFLQSKILLSTTRISFRPSGLSNISDGWLHHSFPMENMQLHLRWILHCNVHDYIHEVVSKSLRFACLNIFINLHFTVFFAPWTCSDSWDPLGSYSWAHKPSQPRLPNFGQSGNALSRSGLLGGFVEKFFGQTGHWSHRDRFYKNLHF